MMVRGAAGVDSAAVDTATRGSLYSLLLKQIRSAGLLERRSAYYIRKIVITGTMLVAGWTAFALVGDSWW